MRPCSPGWGSDCLLGIMGRGFSRSNLQDMRRFHEAFQICQTVSGKSKPKVGELPAANRSLREMPDAVWPIRAEAGGGFQQAPPFEVGRTTACCWGSGSCPGAGFYFAQAACQRWSVRELQRQINGALYERVAPSSDTRALVRLERRTGPAEIANYREAFKDPYLLEFRAAAYS